MRIVSFLAAAMAICATAVMTTGAVAADKLAQEFGTAPSMWDVRLSPSGTKLSYIQMHESGIPVAVVIDLAKGKTHVVMASIKDTSDVNWCDWVSDERLLCGMRGVADLPGASNKFYTTRLVAANFDGDKQKVFFQKEMEGGFFQFTDQIVDWLVDDPEHVLVQEPGGRGSGVARLDVNSGGMTTVEPAKSSVFTWASDGHGNVRLYNQVTHDTTSWYVRITPDSDWTLLQEAALDDLVTYSPVGFDETGNILYVMKDKDGRRALYAHDLAANTETLVFAHPYVDAGGAVTMGKFHRLVGVSYATEQNHRVFFDTKVENIIKGVQASFPGKEISIVSENWDENLYILHVGSDDDPGAYYFMDAKKNAMGKLRDYLPQLTGLTLARMQPHDYKAADGSSIPAYLTLPPGKDRALPTVILPHGGPEARDYLGYDFLSQYLAAKGYAVLQSNYRGSGGYGKDWSKGGGFQDWATAVSDLKDGADALIAEGIADPEQICTVGWSYGGYAAMMAAIKHPELFNCVASIAGVSDPAALIGDMKSFVGSRAAESFIGLDSQVLRDGSPRLRASELTMPLLLIHGEKDVNVPYDHSQKMARAVKSAHGDVKMVSYKEADHQIFHNADRIDLLDNLGAFLKKNIGG